MNYQGLLIGFAAFLIIGLFHPLVVKLELHFGQRPKIIFAALAMACIVVSVFVENYWFSILLGCLGFSCIWTVFEIGEQRKRRLRNEKTKN